MGLITLSPASNLPGLVILGSDAVHWLDVEASSDEPRCDNTSFSLDNRSLLLIFQVSFAGRR